MSVSDQNPHGDRLISYRKILPCECQPAGEVKYGQIETNPTVVARVDQRSTANVTSLKGKPANSDLCNIRCSLFQIGTRLTTIVKQHGVVATKRPERDCAINSGKR